MLIWTTEISISYYLIPLYQKTQSI